MSRGPSRTLGVDLASKPNRTAACVIEWPSNGADAISYPARLDDTELLKLLRDESFQKIAIDAPFGWPVEFVSAVYGWSDPAKEKWPVEPSDPEGRQPQLLLRETDRVVLEVTGEPFEGSEAIEAQRRGKRPLSVSADKLGIVAMRCVRLLAEVGRLEGRPIDRAGSGRILEVYPDAALREWGFWQTEWDQARVGYKGTKEGPHGRRERLVHDLIEAGRGWLRINDELECLCVAKDDPFDALISALIARAAAVGLTRPIRSPEHRERAKVEGWIHLPTPGSFEALAP